MKKLLIYSLMLVLLYATSCKKINEGINVDPNNPTGVGARYDLLINGAQVSSVLFYEGSLARLGGMWTRTFTGSDRQYTSLYNYETTSGDYDDNWTRLYAVILPNAKLAERQAAELSIADKTTMGISEVMQAQGLGTAADLWGDIPFTEAGDPIAFPKPKFDPQLQVYTGVQNLLTTAIANFAANQGGSGPGAKDIFYAGSRAKWTAAAYTLKARFYLHTKEYDKAITNALLGITSAANNMRAPHGGTYGKDFNVYYSFLSYDRPAYMNASGSFAANLLRPGGVTYLRNAKTNEGDRYNYLFQTGLNTADLDPNVLWGPDWGNPSSQDGFFSAVNSFPLVTWQENQLILAEAYMKQTTPDPTSAITALNTVRAYYATGGSANTGTDLSTGYASSGLKYDPYLIIDFLSGGITNPVASGQTQNQALLREILVEKYLTLVGQLEQFNDVRRTKSYLGITPVKGTKLPQRFLYAQSEINTNPNTPAVTIADLFKETPVNTTPY